MVLFRINIDIYWCKCYKYDATMIYECYKFFDDLVYKQILCVLYIIIGIDFKICSIKNQETFFNV